MGTRKRKQVDMLDMVDTYALSYRTPQWLWDGAKHLWDAENVAMGYGQEYSAKYRDNKKHPIIIINYLKL